ncbi:hypothetical protein GJ496_001504 [Pomphorhynchus laevis]|nr:hypothetical protein GJ496_001504 [Pomphorhynchus laevis]
MLNQIQRLYTTDCSRSQILPKSKTEEIARVGFGDSLMTSRNAFSWSYLIQERAQFLDTFITQVFGPTKGNMRIGCLVTDEENGIVAGRLAQLRELFPFSSVVAINPSYRVFLSDFRKLLLLTMSTRSILTRWWLPKINMKKYDFPDTIKSMTAEQKFYTFIGWMCKDEYKPHIDKLMHCMTIQNLPCSVVVSRKDKYLQYDAIDAYAKALECFDSNTDGSKRLVFNNKCSVDDQFSGQFVEDLADRICATMTYV